MIAQDGQHRDINLRIEAKPLKQPMTGIWHPVKQVARYDQNIRLRIQKRGINSAVPYPQGSM